MARPTRVIVEADGGARGNPGPAAYGAVLRDADTGEVIAERAAAIGVASNNVAEYNGLIAGLELLREYAPDASDVEVRMDSQLVIEQMSGRWKVKHPDMKPLATKANGLAPFGVTWTWVPRADNLHADRLVNLALDDALGEATQARAHPQTPTDATPLTSAQPTAPDPSSPNQVARWSPDLGPPTRLVLLRHGETELTAQQRFSGAGGADPSLSGTGRQQAGAATARLEGDDVAAVLASPLARARETAQIVADVLGLPVELDGALREAAFGAWDGLTFGEVRERWPEELDRWLGSTTVAPPGGESFDDVAVRVRRFHGRVLESYPGQTLLVVSHSTPIKLLACAAIGAPTTSIFRMDVVAGSLSVAEWYADGFTALRALSQLP
jgi:ribonuclease H / adenosylcobalamin/alpha-ribazole phosphatase